MSTQAVCRDCEGENFSIFERISQSIKVIVEFEGSTPQITDYSDHKDDSSAAEFLSVECNDCGLRATGPDQDKALAKIVRKAA